MTTKPAQTDSLADTMVEGIAELLLFTVQLGWWLVCAGVCNPVLTAGGVAVWAVLHWHGPVAAEVVCAGLVLALLGWRLTHAASFGRAVGLPVVATTLGGIYRLRWRHVATRHGLVAESYAGGRGSSVDREVASVGQVKAAPGLLRLGVHLPAGLTPGDVEDACEGLAHAFKVRECRVEPDRPGWVWLELHRRDLLAARLAAPMFCSPAPPVQVRAPCCGHYCGDFPRGSLPGRSRSRPSTLRAEWSWAPDEPCSPASPTPIRS